jgi:aryl-alcohol dehydrogenase-like predicted oxidoreductase
VAQIALAWLLHQDIVTSVIVGAKRVDQLEDNIAATDVTLSQSDVDALNDVSALSKEYPGWMFEMQQARHD